MNNNSFNFENLDISSIQFIIFTPFDEFYYIYSINSLDSQHLIERDNIYEMVRYFDKEKSNRTTYLSRRFLPFMYIVETKELLELEESPTEEDLKKHLRLNPNKINELEEKEKNTISLSTHGSLYKKVLNGFSELFNS